MTYSFRRLIPLIAAATAGLFLTQCASLQPRKESSQVRVLPRESVLVLVQSLDSGLVAELTRVGVDPVGFEAKVKTEIEYHLLQRKQEVAKDSASTDVFLTLTMRYTTPTAMSTGVTARMTLRADRGTQHQQETWTWTSATRKNLSGMRAGYFSRDVADEVMTHVKARKQYEPVPPLILFN